MSSSSESETDCATKGPTIDFTDQNIDHDRVLLVEGIKFYVSKKLMSLLAKSTLYFKSLSGKDLTEEAKMNEIEIDKEVSAEDFKPYLLFIHSEYEKISKKSVIPITKLAHYFLHEEAMVACNKFIAKNIKKIHIFDLLEVAVDFDIDDIKKRIGSIIFASPHGITASRRCNSCKYCTRDAEYCGHNDEEKTKITINWFIHWNKDRICQASSEVKNFIIKASVGDYK